MFIIKAWSMVIGSVSLRYNGTIDGAERLAHEVGGAALIMLNGSLFTIEEYRYVKSILT